MPQWDYPIVVDRLLVGALIEARSCERFKLLMEAMPEGTPEDLRAFYEELFACEARHYRGYVDLAKAAARAALPDADADAAVEGRLEGLAEAEGAIVRALATREQRATVHG
jgi:tRNA 2-(methylsulfanyl)-N6-isopentenyladenosine37 hydroxylase